MTTTPTIEPALTDVKCELIMVSPSQAKTWLKANTKNRELRETNLRALRHSIGHMGWQLTPDCIAFEGDFDLLRNGQHRLHVIANGEQAMPCLVAWGLPREVYDATDRGRKRNLADQLHVRGESNAKDLAAAIRLLYQYEQTGEMRHNSGGSTYPDSLLINFFYDGRPDLRHSVRSWKSVILPNTGLSVLHYCFRRAHGDLEADEFMRGLLKGSGLEADDPRHVVRERIIRSKGLAPTKANPRLFGLSMVEMRALVIIAFNKWIKGERVRSFTWRPGGANPQRFPHVDGYPYIKRDAYVGRQQVPPDR